MKTIYIARDPLDRDSWTRHEVENVSAFLLTQFDRLPDNARIYRGDVAESCDVTPQTAEQIEALEHGDEPLYLVCWPGGFTTIALVVVGVIAVAAALLAAKKPPIPTIRNTAQTSPNNELSQRVNSARPNARIPHIKGRDRSIPDLIALPYSVYQDHQEVEVVQFCVGVGPYDISDVRDGSTSATQVDGLSVAIYGPGESVLSADTPQLQIGPAITELPLAMRTTRAVNGQVLLPPTAGYIYGTGNITFKYPDLIRTSSPDLDFTQKFGAGDTVIISNARYAPGVDATLMVSYRAGGIVQLQSGTWGADFSVGRTLILQNAQFVYQDPDPEVPGIPFSLNGYYEITAVSGAQLTLEGGNPGSVNPDWDSYVVTSGDATPFTSQRLRVETGAVLFDLSGTYTLQGVSSSQMQLDNPAAVNADWAVLDTLDNDESAAMSPVLQSGGSGWIGPFFLRAPDTTSVICNFVALNGAYKDDGTNQYAVSVPIAVEVTPTNSAGTPTGSPVVFNGALQGSATLRSSRALTIRCDLTAAGIAGYVRVRAQRTQGTDESFQGQVVDEVKWKACYFGKPMGVPDYGNVTTGMAVTLATDGALSVKERELNMLAVGKIPIWTGSGTSFSAPAATNNAADIFIDCALDPFIGRRTVAELDLAQIRSTIEAVEDYFGTSVATEFNYTFDANISFEETAELITRAVFCNAYRTGSLIKWDFERETAVAAVLFNHRNKMPKTERRTITFGVDNDFDGVAVKYVDPDTETQETFRVPEDGSAGNPEEIELVGIRNRLQARFFAYRRYNKQQLRHTAVEFTALAEGDLILRDKKILVSDNTRAGTQDGEVVGVDGLALTLSQPVSFTDVAGYTIFLQLQDGTTQAIACSAGAAPRQVVLASAPALPLVIDSDVYARTAYWLTGNSEPRAVAFLVAEKGPAAGLTMDVQAINYDAGYYANDSDYSAGICDIKGNPL